MRKWKRMFITLCYLTILIMLDGCNKNIATDTDALSYPNGMTELEKSKVSKDQTTLGEKITFFDEETATDHELMLLASSTYDPMEKTSFYLIQEASFNEVHLTALREYLNSEAPQTLLGFITNGDDMESDAETNRNLVEQPQGYAAFLSDNLFGWFCENYSISPENLYYVGYETAGYFSAYMLHTRNSISNYLIVNPTLQKKTDKEDIASLENTFFSKGNTSLPANVYIIRSEEDQRNIASTKTDAWISSLRDHDYKGLTLESEILSGFGHNTMDCEALLRGICCFNDKKYGTAEFACVDASRSMTPVEEDSITVGKLSEDHEYYNEVVGIDPACAEYINEIVMYDEEINDSFVIHLSMPPDYDEDKRYPLLLMTDGVWRLSDHPELHQLMSSGEVEKVILASVGYPNGYDYRKIRERDLLQQPDLYLQFIVENLIPYLYNNYPVDTTKTTLTGHSYGGYWAMYALFHSDTIGKHTFANYYIGSPSFQASTNKSFASNFADWYYARTQDLDCSVYVTVGGEEETPFINLVTKNINEIKDRSYEGLSLDYEIIEDYDHNTVFKPSIQKALKRFYGAK